MGRPFSVNSGSLRPEGADLPRAEESVELKAKTAQAKAEAGENGVSSRI